MILNTKQSAVSDRRQAGVTLMELLIVLVVISILATLAAPSFNGAIARSQVSGVRDSLVSSLQYARSEALKRKSPVSVCSSADQAACAGNNDWQDGWIVFADTDGDSALDGGEQILQVQYAENRVTTYAAAATAITFNRIGQATAGAGDYSMCHPDQETTGRTLSIAVTGAITRSSETIGGC